MPPTAGFWSTAHPTTSGHMPLCAPASLWQSGDIVALSVELLPMPHLPGEVSVIARGDWALVELPTPPAGRYPTQQHEQPGYALADVAKHDSEDSECDQRGRNHDDGLRGEEVAGWFPEAAIADRLGSLFWSHRPTLPRCARPRHPGSYAPAALAGFEVHTLR